MALIIAAMTTGAGALIVGRFRLAKLESQDGMGRLWRGCDEFLDRDVAVKEILLPAELSETARATFLAQTTRAAKSVARLNHPGVITIHDVVEHEGAPWIVMEYVPGASLATRIADSGPLPWQQVAQIGQKIADALAYAHAHGIVHRDLKPDNILLAGDRVVVTDFGLAQIMDATSPLANAGTGIGALSYIAPEKIEGRQTDAAADLWSLGAVLYTAVEGRPPFDGSTLTALVAAILARDPAPTVHAGPLAGLLTRTLAKDPAQRPTATAIAQELGSYLPTAPVPAPSGAQPTGAPGPDPVTLGPVPVPVQRPVPVQQSAAKPPASSGYWAQPPSSGRPARQPPPGGSLVMAALVLSLVAGVGEIVSNFAGPPPYLTLSLILFMLPYALTIITTVIAFSVGRYRRALLPAIAGLWSISLASVTWDLLAIPAFHEFSYGTRYDVSYAIEITADAVGLVTAVLLLVWLNRSAERGQPLVPGFPRVPLFGCAVIGVVALASEYLLPSWGPHYPASEGGGYLYSKYPDPVEAVVMIVLAVFIAWYALARPGRVPGGVLLLGWYASTIFWYVSYIWNINDYFTQQATALSVIAGLCLGVGLLLTLAYLRSRPSAAPTGPG